MNTTSLSPPVTTTSINSRRKRSSTSTMAIQNLYEIIDLEDDDDDDDDDEVVLVSGPAKRGSTKSNAISVEDEEEEEIKVLWFKTPFPKRNKKFLSSVTEVGESSNSAFSKAKPFECQICADEKPQSESFSVGICNHAYCTDCTAKYIAAKLSDNVTAIPCPSPECTAAMEPYRCRKILSGEVFDRWGLALCEALVLSSGKAFYCPYKDCSAPMLDDGDGGVVAEACCPSCHRLFCAGCQVAWHAGVTCEEFRRLGSDERASEDLMLKNLADSEKWKRCPCCRFYVERSDGCLYMKCRCGIAFCYNCTNVYTEHNTHFCTKCKH